MKKTFKEPVIGSLHRELELAKYLGLVLMWSPLSKRYYALPIESSKAHNLEIIKSFE